ncbi:MAG: esterase [Planctomycetaceae bacterium]|nr:MAG: esterase [Planctomycetaceae bacterium]
MRPFAEHRWTQAINLAEEWVNLGRVPAITFMTGTATERYGPITRGSLWIDREERLPVNPIYLVASITKPLVALAVLQLAEAGLLSLHDRVADYLPEFGRRGKYGVEIRHLLTHTSGLPDMLPNDRDLRKAQASLDQFLQGVYEAELAFPPGRAVQYQSMGYLVLSAIVETITGSPTSLYLRQTMFAPLSMHDTALGAPAEWWAQPAEYIARIPEIRVEGDARIGVGWNWNSVYWKTLGAPWGGLLTTAPDLAQLAQTLLRRGISPDGQMLWSSQTIGMATTNQLGQFPELAETDKRYKRWGYGWRLNWVGHATSFGDLLSENVYGHWGATGTLLWIDPYRGIFSLILSTQPQETTGFFLRKLSNVLSACWPM